VQHQQAGFPTLSKEEQAELDRILADWERESDKVKTLTATFTMWEYGGGFNAQVQPADAQKPTHEYTGEIHFAAPDKGSYEIKTGGDAHWVCDGTAIYEFDSKQKRVKEYRLPKELQGKAITKGPLPFVFGAKAEALRQRYWMRVITPPDAKSQIWIEAWPRWQQDAANFHHVQLILDSKTMLPAAIRMYDVIPAHKVYAFTSTTVNGAWDKIKDFFVRPRTPLGWQHEVVETPADAQGADQPPPSADSRGKTSPSRQPAKQR
jgi:TIGR03009 family protein